MSYQRVFCRIDPLTVVPAINPLLMCHLPSAFSFAQCRKLVLNQFNLLLHR